MSGVGENKIKKKPQRTCVVCRTKKDKRDLLRIVLTTEGEIKYDPTGKTSGRGAYLCKNEECIKAELAKSAKLSKGLKHQVKSEDLAVFAKEILKECEMNPGEEN